MDWIGKEGEGASWVERDLLKVEVGVFVGFPLHLKLRWTRL